MGLWSLIVEAAWNFQKILAIHSSQHLIQTAELVLKSFQDCRGGLHPVGPPNSAPTGRNLWSPNQGATSFDPSDQIWTHQKIVLDTDLPAASGGFRRHLFCSLVRFQWDNFFFPVDHVSAAHLNLGAGNLLLPSTIHTWKMGSSVNEKSACSSKHGNFNLI